MAGFNYSGRGYSDDWNKTTYGGTGGADHSCRPAVLEPDGRTRPIAPFAPTRTSETYFKASQQRIVEQIHTPVVVAEYKYSTHHIVDPYNPGAAAGLYDGWRNSGSPERDRGKAADAGYGYNSPTKVEPVKGYGEYGYKAPTKSEPVKGYGEYGYSAPAKGDSLKNYGGFAPVAADKWSGDRSPAAANEYGYGYPPSKVEPVKDSAEKWGRPLNPVRDYPPADANDYGYGKVDQVKDARPTTRPNNFPRTQQWRHPSGGDTANYGDYPDYSTNGGGGGSDDYYLRNGGLSEPALASKESGWSHNRPLSGPTNDIGTAVEMLKEAVKSAFISPTPAASALGLPKRESRYTNTIDSTEASKRYGNFNLQQSSYPGRNTNVRTIDSRDAERMYGGAAVPRPM